MSMLGLNRREKYLRIFFLLQLMNVFSSFTANKLNLELTYVFLSFHQSGSPPSRCSLSYLLIWLHAHWNHQSSEGVTTDDSSVEHDILWCNLPKLN